MKIDRSSLLIISVTVSIIVFSLFVKIKIDQKQAVEKATSVQVVYKNPFEKKTQYQNPFDEYQNPIDDLVFAQ